MVKKEVKNDRITLSKANLTLSQCCACPKKGP